MRCRAVFLLPAVALVGGNCNNGENCGADYLNLNNSAGNANWKDGKPVLDENGKQVTKGRMLDFMGFQFHHDRTTIRKSNIEAARRKANHISKQDKISWYNASVMLSYMGLFKHTDTYNYYIEYIKPKINVKKLKRIVSKHSRKENEHDRLEKGDDVLSASSGLSGCVPVTFFPSVMFILL